MNRPTQSPDDHATGRSSLLDELAGEATSKLQALQAAEQDHRDRSLQLHDALNRLFKFFKPFSQHVNQIAPTIDRAIRFDAKTVFTPLHWSNAVADLRKQDLTDDALLDHVIFRFTLTPPAPVGVTRRWAQMDTLKAQLHGSGLRTLDDLDDLFRKRQREDTFDTLLAPDFVLQMKFMGNYQTGQIDLSCINLHHFSPTSLRLFPADVTTTVLDAFGRYLIGRTDVLPGVFRLT